MLILALESSAKAASAALWEDGLLGLSLMHCGLTHSETLLPMAEELLKRSGRTMGEVDLVAVARGPGSFTGIRIGVATAKGLCWGGEKPCCGVSTLEAMAWQGAHLEGRLLCCVMDARRNQVYNGLFRAEGDRVSRLSEDRAIALADLLPELTEPPVLIGDGAKLTAAEMDRRGMPYTLAPEPIRIQSAWGVALAALHTPESAWGEPDPVYLRLSQAERERLERMKRSPEA
jgi:tRNA threonylcarbamoyladenosine biosynthesis protein TsaB